MRVLIVTDLYTNATNGVVTSVRNLAKGLLDEGHQVRILTLSENGNSYEKDGVFYVRSYSLEWVYPNLRGSHSLDDDIVRALVSWKPEIIHTQSEFFTFHFARHIAKATGAPIVHTYHTQYEDYAGYLIPWESLSRVLVAPFMRHRLKHASEVIAPSEKTRCSLEKAGIKKGVKVIPSGIDLEKYQERISEEKRQALRHSLGIPKDSFVLLSLGRLGKEKSVDELLLAFAWLLEDIPEAILLLVGDGPAKRHLRSYVEELEIGDKVIFTGGVSPDDVRLYYQMADIFVSASKSETQGLVYVEAISNGLPLVCRRDPCLKGILEEGRNGYSFETPEEFSTDIALFFADADFCGSAGRRSRELSNRYSRQQFASSVASLYEQVKRK